MHIDTIFDAIGRFAVKFRWLVLVVWLAGTIGAVAGLPALSSVTQNNNSKFLPASAPSEHAAELAAPFGTANLIPVPVVAARTGSPLTPADTAAMTALVGQLRTVHLVSQVLDGGRSADGQAEQLIVLAGQGGGNQNDQLNLVDDLRAKIAQAHLPAGLHAHLAGDVAIQVDQQKASGNQGNQVQDLSIVFIVVL
ncbi:MAG: MMPL family transporter, partial [Actinomycetota bacterium]